MLEGLGSEHQVERLVGIRQPRQVLRSNTANDLAGLGAGLIVGAGKLRQTGSRSCTPSIRLISAIWSSRIRESFSARKRRAGAGSRPLGRAQGSPGPCVGPAAWHHSVHSRSTPFARASASLGERAHSSSSLRGITRRRNSMGANRPQTAQVSHRPCTAAEPWSRTQPADPMSLVPDRHQYSLQARRNW